MAYPKGRPHSAETKRKISLAHKGRPKTPDWRAKIGAANKGQKRTPEQRARMSQAKHNPSAETRARMSQAQKGRPAKWTLDAAQRVIIGKKISETSTGQAKTQQHRDKLALANMGKTLSPETKQKLSKRFSDEGNPLYGKRGALSPNWGEKRTPAQKAKMSQAQKGHPGYTKGRHPSEETRKKLRASAQAKHLIQYPLRASHRRPTGPERRFLELCEVHNLPFEYTGDGRFWIQQMNPDFICPEQKVVVEVFGNYWHNPLLMQTAYRAESTVEYRKQLLAKEGWRLIVIWESELKDPTTRAKILGRLRKQLKTKGHGM